MEGCPSGYITKIMRNISMVQTMFTQKSGIITDVTLMMSMFSTTWKFGTRTLLMSILMKTGVRRGAIFPYYGMVMVQWEISCKRLHSKR